MRRFLCMTGVGSGSELVMAHDPAEARRLLSGRGIPVLSVRDLSPAPWSAPWRWVGALISRPRPSLSRRDRMSVLRSLRLRVENGIAPQRALLDLVEQERPGRLKEALGPARNALLAGLPLHESVRRIRLLDENGVKALQAGEESGRLPDVIGRLIADLDVDYALWAVLAGTILFIGFELIFAFGMNIFVGEFIIPTFTGLAAEIEDPARRADFLFMMDMARLANHSLMVLLVITVSYLMLLGSVLRDMARKPWLQRRRNLDWIVSSTPLVRRYVECRSLDSTFQVCARLLLAGMPPVPAIRHAGGAATSTEVRRFWDGMLADLLKGIPLQLAVRRPPLSGAEQSALAGHGSALSLASCMELLCRDRQREARALLKQAGLWSMYLLAAYLLASASIPLAANMIHSDVLQSLFRSL